MKTQLTHHFIAALLGALCLPWSSAQAQPATFGNALSFNGVDQYVSITNFGAIAPTNEITVEFDEESDRIWARILIDEHWVASYAGEMQRHMDAIYKLATGTPVCGHLELGMEIERILQQIKATLDLAIGVINAAPY